MSDASRVEALAERAVERAIERRSFTITKFGRHEDGYFHAHVTPAGGKRVYVHRRFGSWLAPGSVNNKAVLKEVTKDVAIELQKKARAYERAEKNGPAEPDGGGESDV